MDKPDLLTVLNYYQADTSRVREFGWTKIRCPVHDDHDPSFSVNLEAQRVHCFACPVSGDVYDLIEAKEGTDIRGAIRWAQEHAGLERGKVHKAPAGRYRSRWREDDD